MPTTIQGDDLPRPQIKVCGLTQVDQAVECAELGADAIGLVFYPKSPRCVTVHQAMTIAGAIGNRAAVIGVFVDVPVEEVLATADRCQLSGVQLHGQETPQMAEQIANAGLRVIKALFLKRAPYFELAAAYHTDGVLLECGLGRLPGGNAEDWDWAAARPIGENRPLVLAGGLTPENVVQAIKQGKPDAVDVSTGVEVRPGKKDLKKVNAFISAVMHSGDLYTQPIRRIF